MNLMQKIPRCMSTQHPDNVHSPFFASGPVVGGEDEITEAYYVFSHLGCDEQMWDCEGKEVDSFVVKKLFSKYEPFFRQHTLGKDVFITLRVPNPEVERAESKILLETLESIPRSFDIAKLFYGEEISPVFEVILPMASSAKSIDRIYKYFRDFVINKQTLPCSKGDITIAEWIGEFNPKTINVIPLFEDRDNMLNAHNVIEEYVKDKQLDYQRVFLAHSDPAMNYGMISALLLNKLALKNLHDVSKKIGLPIYPILGVGSAPMRGNLTPYTVDQILQEYPSVQTFSIQSAFKFDHPTADVIKAIEKLQAFTPQEPHALDVKRSLDIVNRCEKAFQAQILELAPAINQVAKFVSKRRKRKLHVGLFGYSRSVGSVSLPRAITFTSALYSLGVPPELLGLNCLTKEDIQYLRSVYINFDHDLRCALQFHNPDSPFLPQEVKSAIQNLNIDYEINSVHQKTTQTITQDLAANKTDSLSELILKAANLRHFLG